MPDLDAMLRWSSSFGRRPSARLKADEAVRLFREGGTVTQVANALGIGRGSVYRALETCGIKQAHSSGLRGDAPRPTTQQIDPDPDTI